MHSFSFKILNRIIYTRGLRFYIMYYMSISNFLKCFLKYGLLFSDDYIIFNDIFIDMSIN